MNRLAKVATVVIACGGVGYGLMKVPAVRNSTPVVETLRLLGKGRPLDYPGPEAKLGWVKHGEEPVLGGGEMGTAFDIALVAGEEDLSMYFSWRPKKAIGVCQSSDGYKWRDVKIALEGIKGTWEDQVNRPVVVHKDDKYWMWYTGHDPTDNESRIGLATSNDGITWTRHSKQPVLEPVEKWEKANVMCPHVIFDEDEQIFKMWYSGGDRYEPDAIGYATSPDGIKWTRLHEPIFSPGPKGAWDGHKATACCVLKQPDGYLMFYIGFKNEHNAAIGIARSKDGIHDWQRNRQNPILTHAKDQKGWDADAVYKPYVVRFKGKWMLFYNGRRMALERIGVAVNASNDLWQ